MKASDKLKELCDKFQTDVIDRSRIAREKQNLPSESVKIPDYRQLVQTKKFEKFSKCTCDHSSHTKIKSACKEHKKDRKNSSFSSGSGKENNSGSDTDTSFSSGSDVSESGSSRASSCDRDSKKNTEEKEENNKKYKPLSEEKFEDIRSMEINRKHNHPERLHPDLSYNEPDQVNFFFFVNSKIIIFLYLLVY